MEKNVLLLFIIVFHLTMKAQNISYGPVIGGVYYQSNNNNGTNHFLPGESFSPNFGGYVEYSFDKNLGLKTDLTFNQRELKYWYYSGVGIYETPNIKMNLIELCPNLKYDFGDEYRKGFYMLFGPRFSLMTKATSNEANLEDSFEKFNAGVQLGLGQRVFKIIDLQGKFDYGITPFFKANDGNNSKFFGAYISLNVDVEKILSK